MTKTLNVDLGDRGYPIYIGAGLLGANGDGGAGNKCLRRHLSTGPHVIVTNETVAPLYLDMVRRGLGDVDHHVITIPDGERFKTLDTLNTIMTGLLQCGAHRRSTLLALGGGVVGDISGFAAACYRRGMPFIQIPTTLLAQVDSSVGGKTAVNHELGKNMIGAFYQPQAVVIDTAVLATLPPAHYRAGLAEIIKYGLLAAADFFSYLEQHIDDLLAQKAGTLTYAIERSCAIKAAIVAQDERETGGARMLLNLGHTFAHAIETGLGHGAWLHGEAVGCGLVLAARFSEEAGLLDTDSAQRITALVERAGLPGKQPDAITPQNMLDLMARDKKNTGDGQKLILLRAIGDAFVEPDCDTEKLRAFLST